MSRLRRPPELMKLLDEAIHGEKKPAAFVLAGHNGSGKSLAECQPPMLVAWTPRSCSA